MTAPVPFHRFDLYARVRELRRAWRSFWWMVVRRPPAPRPEPDLSRRTWLGIAVREARCGLLTGGKHSWGPLAYEYEGARWRKQPCRWCKASRTPAEEFERNPLTKAEQREGEQFLATAPPTDEDMERAIAMAERAGVLRNGKWIWD